MKKIILSIIVSGLIFSACHTAKKAQHTVNAPAVINQSPAEKKKPVDSVAIMKEALTDILNTPVTFVTFYGKAKANFSSAHASGNATIYIHIQKDSVIWISITGPLNIEGARVLLTRDSVKIINKLEGSVHLSSIEHLQKITKFLFSFNDFQNVILGKPSIANNTELSFDFKPDSIIVSAQQSFINYIFSFTKSNLIPVQSRFIANNNGNVIDANVVYNNYQTVNGINFSADRNIAVSGTSPMKLELNFKEFYFNQPQTFPFTIPKNYTVKYD